MLAQKINQQGSWLDNGFMLHTVDGEPYRNSGKIDLSSHAQLASICASQDSSPKLFLSNSRLCSKWRQKKSVFRMSYTHFVSVSIPLGEIVAIFGNKSAEPFFSTSDFELDKYNAFPL